MGEEDGSTISITYETLFELLRREKNRDEIQKIQKTFYTDVNSYLNDKKALIESRTLSDSEKEKTQKQAENTKKMVRELFERREKKIIILALNKVRTSSAMADTTALLDSEKYFFHKLVEFFSDYRAEMLDSVLGSANAIKAPEYAKEVPKDAQKETIKAKEPSPLGRKTVKFTAPVPKFMGKELEIYGPYSTSDEATLPKDIAEVLIRKGRAVEIGQE